MDDGLLIELLFIRADVCQYW
ncbi:hypothetical protein D030_4950A, partial [Vibrio parahaemolyticus AQ3810]